MALREGVATYLETELTEETILTIRLPGVLPSGTSDHMLTRLCQLLIQQYETTVKLVILEFMGTQNAAGDGKYYTGTTDSVLSANRLELFHNILLDAPYFSVASVRGDVRDLSAALAIFCDWRLLAEEGSFRFTLAGEGDLRTGARLAELTGSFSALDSLIRSCAILHDDAIRLGLGQPKGSESIELICNHAKGRNKETIRIMRQAVRKPSGSDQSIARILASLASAKAQQ